MFECCIRGYHVDRRTAEIDGTSTTPCDNMDKCVFLFERRFPTLTYSLLQMSIRIRNTISTRVQRTTIMNGPTTPKSSSRLDSGFEGHRNLEVVNDIIQLTYCLHMYSTRSDHLSLLPGKSSTVLITKSIVTLLPMSESIWMEAG